MFIVPNIKLPHNRLNQWTVGRFQLLPFLLLVSLTGCGGAPKLNRIAIQGDIKHDGKKVQRGIVYLIPAKGHSAPSAGPVSIHQGRYELTLTKGPVAGKYRIRVEISSADLNEQTTGKKIDDSLKNLDTVSADQLEGKWEFSVTVPEIDREAEEQKPIQFDLKLDKKHRLKKKKK